MARPRIKTSELGLAVTHAGEELSAVVVWHPDHPDDPHVSGAIPDGLAVSTPSETLQAVLDLVGVTVTHLSDDLEEALDRLPDGAGAG